jgi:hypothetical protein
VKAAVVVAGREVLVVTSTLLQMAETAVQEPRHLLPELQPFMQAVGAVVQSLEQRELAVVASVVLEALGGLLMEALGLQTQEAGAGGLVNLQLKETVEMAVLV